MRQSHMRPSTMSKLPKAHRKFTDNGLSSILCILCIKKKLKTKMFQRNNL